MVGVDQQVSYSSPRARVDWNNSAQRHRQQPASTQRIQITATENIEFRFHGLMPKKV
jgi:hypothetical protein